MTRSTLDELQAFIAVVDSGSISAAAEQVQQTTSGVSRALARLETKLGTTLLNRTTRRLQLTDEGSSFLVQAREIIAALEQAEAQLLQRHGAPAGRLRVDAAMPFVLHVIAPLVAGYRERFPQVHLEINSSERYIDLLERRTDVAIRIGPLADSTLHARPLGSSRIRVMASPAYLDRHGVPARVMQLRQHVLLGFSEPETLNRWPLVGEGGQPLQITPTVAASSGETLRALVLQGAGIACLSDFMTWRDRRDGRLVELFADNALDMRQPINAVYYRNSALSARITSFLDHLQEHAGNGDFCAAAD